MLVQAVQQGICLSVSISFLNSILQLGPKALLQILVHVDEAEPRSLNLPVPKLNLQLIS